MCTGRADECPKDAVSYVARKLALENERLRRDNRKRRDESDILKNRPGP
jgi:hypothetical protein